MEYQAQVDVAVFGPARDRIGLLRAIATSNGLQICDEGIVVRFMGEVSDVEGLFDALKRLGDVDFEITSTTALERRRLVFAWGIGAGSATVDAFGNVVLTEPQVKFLLRKSDMNLIEFERSLREATLAPWEDIFERARLGQLSYVNQGKKTNVA